MIEGALQTAAHMLLPAFAMRSREFEVLVGLAWHRGQSHRDTPMEG